MQASLARNILRALAWPTLIPLFAAGGLSYFVAQDVINNTYDQNLLNLAHGLATHLSDDETGPVLSLSPEAETVLRTDTVDRIFFRVRNGRGELLAGDRDLGLADAERQRAPAVLLGAPPPGTLEPRREEPPLFYDSEYQGLPVRGVSLHHYSGGQGFYVTVAETLGKRRQAMERLLFGFAAAAALILIAAALAVRFGIPSGLAPLRRLEHELAGRSGTDLAPVNLAGVPVEIREVVRALNALLGRLREANASQRHFLQDAAHQLRTPLASLQVQLELMGDGHADAAALARLRHSVARVTRLANQLLALARAESGDRLLADAPPVNLAELIDDMLEDWLRLADSRNIDFGVQREPATLIGDPTLLRELISNLVDNALKYTPAGGQVTLHCHSDEEAVLIEVADSGPGIPPAERERVFERFHRVAGTQPSGSGLGLPIAREIARSHGGTITIEDGPDGGSSVRVRLPLKRAAVEAAA